MKIVTLPIPIDADKLEAIRQFTSSDKPPIEDEILALVEKIYTKTVPEPVRRFIENRARETDVELPVRRKDRGAAQEKVLDKTQSDAAQMSDRSPDDGDGSSLR